MMPTTSARSAPSSTRRGARTVSLPSLPLKTYPGVHIPLPLAAWVYEPDRWDFDIVFAQTTSLLVELPAGG